MGVFIIAKSITRRFTHGSASANFAQSTRISQMDGLADGVSRPKIRRYLIRGLAWWVNSSGIWKHAELKAQYIGSCRDPGAADFAALALRQYHITELHSDVRQTTARVTALELAA